MPREGDEDEEEGEEGDGGVEWVGVWEHLEIQSIVLGAGVACLLLDAGGSAGGRAIAAGR